MKRIQVLFLFFFLFVNQFAVAKTTNFYFGGKSLSVANTFINPYSNGKTPPANVPTFALHNLIPPSTEKFIVSDFYDLSVNTGLNTPTNTQSLTTINGKVKNDNTGVQAVGIQYGLHINLAQVVGNFPFELPNSSVQLVNNFSPAPFIWSQPTNTMFCVSGNMNLYESVLGSNPNLANQQMISFLFMDTVSQKKFWWNIMLYDSRTTQIPDDFIMKDNPKDTGHVIVITYAKKQGGSGKYLRDIPGYGNPLRPFYTGANKPGATDIGGCIQRDQFLAVINEMKSIYKPELNAMSTDLSKYVMNHTNTALEIAHNFSKDRSMGMSVNEQWIYNRDDAPVPTAQYGFFTNSTSNIGYVCNVNSSRGNLSGWVDVGNGCYQQTFNELSSTAAATNACPTKKMFCNSENILEEYACGCTGNLAYPWVKNEERNSAGSIWRTCFRYKTGLPCIK